MFHPAMVIEGSLRSVQVSFKIALEPVAAVQDSLVPLQVGLAFVDISTQTAIELSPQMDFHVSSHLVATCRCSIRA